MAILTEGKKTVVAQPAFETANTTRLTYAGLFVITMANLMYENLLTRIFSVTMYYNFAFMAVSIALFGMTVGSIIVYLARGRFHEGNIKQNLAIFSLLFGVTIIISFYLHTQVLFSFDASAGLLMLFANYVIIAIPFIFGGVVVSLALTKFPGHVSKLYAADLIGAALGCVVFVLMLKYISGPTGVALIGLLSCLGGLLFALDTNRRRLQTVSLSASALLAVLFVIQVVLSGSGSAPLKLKWVKGQIEPPLLYEKWNSYSRVRVIGDPDEQVPVFGWSISSELRQTLKHAQLYLDIDASAATVLTRYDGDPASVEYLKHDITNMVHYIRPNANVLVIGAGGGRDVLSALIFNQPSITGVEINENIIDIVNRQFGAFTGHLDQQPGVRFVADEARSYVARSNETYDIIQVSLIDTWAATAAGAYVFTENSLYTKDTWKLWLDHLSDDGVITYSRWYFPELPAEMYRLTALASVSLINAGIDNPRDHIIIMRYLPEKFETDAAQKYPDGLGTVLVSKTAFTQQDIATLHQAAEANGFEVALSAQDELDPTFALLTNPATLQETIDQFSLDITPPDDNRPFFFHTLRLRDIFNQALWKQGQMTFNLVAVITLGVLLITVILLTLLCIVVPLLLTSRRVNLRMITPFMFYFIGIGFGFMLVEISQMQRLTVFLGHPTYSLATALFSLLLSSGLGSYLTEKVDLSGLKTQGPLRLALLLGVLIVFGLITPPIIRAFAGSSNIVRILCAVVILSPLGLFMGMAFPLGMKAASNKPGDITPWLWGINGATSVCASVIAIVIALTFSISTAYWTGFASYGLAFAAFGWILYKQ